MTALAPMPSTATMTWRRLDVAGRESARIQSTATGWALNGVVQVDEAGVAAQLQYGIETDHAWHTRTVRVDGVANGAPVRIALAADGRGRWTRDGQIVPAIDGALDIDLGFSPLTNTLPIRRLDLDIGASSEVRTAWLRFPELRLEALQQSYTRASARRFAYTALVDGVSFSAGLDVDDVGRVLHYDGLWDAVSVDGRDPRSGAPRPE